MLAIDLMMISRLDAAATAHGVTLARVIDPAALPAASEVDLLVVDWSERQPSWGPAIAAWRSDRTRVVLFGRHTDLEAHIDAKRVGLGPMWARSKLVSELDRLFATET